MLLEPMDERGKWLSQTPILTTFRINKLRHFDVEVIRTYLESQCAELGASRIPEFYLVKPDCIVLRSWPLNVHFEKTNNEVIVDVVCAAAVLRGANVFAPGVIGLMPHSKVGDRVDIYGDLDCKCKRGLKIKFEGRKLYVGTGYLKLNRSDLFDNSARPSGIAVQTLLPASNLPVINESIYNKGVVLLQNLPSIVCGWVVDAKQDESILDMCAAPGNKTTHMAEMSENKAFIIAIDKTSQKIQKIRQNCYTHGITCVKAFQYDSTKCFEEKGNKDLNDGPPFVENLFDKVLLDGLCSGLGQRPQLINKMTPTILQSYKFIQRKLLIAASKVLKVGGRLIYSTCTVTIEENEEMVAWALEHIPCLNLVPAEPLLGGPGLPHVGLNDEQRLKVQRFGPENDPLRPVDNIYKESIGFFIAVFKKVSEVSELEIK